MAFAFRWRLLASIAVVCGVVAPASTGIVPAQQQVRPDSLSASAWASLSARLSEPGGYFDTDNLISNESSYLQPLTELAARGVRGGAYIGVGPDQSFSTIAATEPRIAFIIDIRRDNLLQHVLLKALFARSRNRAEFLAKWLGRPVPEDVGRWSTFPIESIVAWLDSTSATPASTAAAVREIGAAASQIGMPLSAEDLATIQRFHRTFIADGVRLRFHSAGRAPQAHYPTLAQLILERDRDGRRASYLASEAAFLRVKTMQARNLIVPVVGDLGGPKALRAIGDEIRARGLRVSVYYASNAEDYVIRDGNFVRYHANVASLPRDAHSTIVRSWFGGPLASTVPGYYTTQLLQPLTDFAAMTPASVSRYADLIGARR